VGASLRASGLKCRLNRLRHFLRRLPALLKLGRLCAFPSEDTDLAKASLSVSGWGIVPASRYDSEWSKIDEMYRERSVDLKHKRDMLERWLQTKHESSRILHDIDIKLMVRAHTRPYGLCDDRTCGPPSAAGRLNVTLGCMNASLFIHI